MEGGIERPTSGLLTRPSCEKCFGKDGKERKAVEIMIKLRKNAIS
jgi:hypothetical protein